MLVLLAEINLSSYVKSYNMSIKTRFFKLKVRVCRHNYSSFCRHDCGKNKHLSASPACADIIVVKTFYYCDDTHLSVTLVYVDIYLSVSLDYYCGKDTHLSVTLASADMIFVMTHT